MRCSTVFTAVLLISALAAGGGSAQDASRIDSTSAYDITTNPLKPADTSSPRATLQSFVDNMYRSYRALMAAHRENAEAPGILTSESVQQMAEEAEGLFERSVSCLDLSEVPETLKKEIAYEAALQLKEIFDRIELPPAHLIPDTDSLETAAGEKRLSTVRRWRVPNTDIVIAAVENGPREGEYLFTPRTVARLDDFYHAVEDLPYTSDAFTTEGFLNFYLTTPGRLLPPKWGQWLPAWSQHAWMSLTIWQWSALVAAVLLLAFVIVAVFRAFEMGATAFSPAARAWKRALFCLVTFVAILGFHMILREQVNITGSVLVFLRFVLQPVWWLLAGAMTFFFATALAETIIASPRIDPEGIQASYFRALFGVLGFVGGAAVFGVGLSRIGVSLIPLLTGLGIGGLAVALAARPTLENIISSFTIFADNPYRVGERVNIMGNIGTVESIGLRSTRIRLLNEHVTTIPNEKMAAMEVENIGRRSCIRRIFNITITYDTSPEKIKRAVDILQEILAVPDGSDPSHPNMAITRTDFPPRVYFNEFNADSLNIYVSYWYHPPEYWDYMEHAHWVNLQIKERFNGEAIDFAFPTQTVHLADDEKRPPNVGRRTISDEEAG